MPEFDFLSSRLKDVKDNTPPEGIYDGVLKTWKPGRTKNGDEVLETAFAIQSVFEADDVDPSNIKGLGLVNNTFWMRPADQWRARNFLTKHAKVVQDGEDIDFKTGFERAINAPVRFKVRHRKSPTDETKVFASIEKFLPMD